MRAMGRKVKVVKDNEGLIPMIVQGNSIVESRCMDEKESFIESKLNKEIIRSISTDESLQEQIDRLQESNFAVRDVVYYHEDLVNYNPSRLLQNDVIVVLYDTAERDRSTYYRWNGTEFETIGSSSYTIDEIDSLVADLNAQLAYLGAKSSIRDVVPNLAYLEDYDISSFVTGDIIVVLDDEQFSHATTYYALDENREWVAHGSMGPNYYNKSEIDSKFAAVDAVLENHEERITDNRSDIDNRISEQDAYDILVGE